MIETERLILRRFVESDAEDVFEYLHQPAVHCFYSMKLDSLDAAKDEMRKRAEDDLYLAIVLKETERSSVKSSLIQRGLIRRMKCRIHSVRAGC